MICFDVRTRVLFLNECLRQLRDENSDQNKIWLTMHNTIEEMKKIPENHKDWKCDCSQMIQESHEDWTVVLNDLYKIWSV